jgi:hypothetical protein
MIDTDKYGANAYVWFLEIHEEYQNARVEGFIPAEWEYQDYLLAEVKRLREELNYTKVTIDDWDKSGPCVTVYHEGCEYVGMLRLYKDENGKVIE